MSDQRISVAVRIRPTIERERYEPLCARKAADDRTIIIKPEETASNSGETSTFEFDMVFDENDDQRAVYEESVQELVDHALSGYNATVFAYGQTGSGKTFTILGKMAPDGQVDAQSGMFLRVFDDLFSYRQAVKDRIHIIITLSALELYVEDVMDLLSNKKKLKLRETSEETLTLGINTVEVTTMSDVIENFNLANSFRSVTATKMNDTSSRSHALFFIDLFQVPVASCPQAPSLSQLIDSNGQLIPNAVPGLVKSRMALIDLAGSERVKKSGVTGQGMVEATAINKSLSILGTVINAMYMQTSHIPFRDSKLTKLLRTSFTETTSRLLLIGQVAPPTSSAPESLGTLRFCDRVKGLKAGQVAGFANPEEEERFLQSLRADEELTAEMRILAAQYYYKPINLRALAAIKGTSSQAEMQSAVATLRAEAPGLIARKEREVEEKMIADAAQERDTEVERFVLHMNNLIDEYESVAQVVKKEKKSAKKLKEEREQALEEMTHDAKKAKKHRSKAADQLEALRADLTAVASEEEEITENILLVQQADVVDDDNAETGGVSGAPGKLSGPTEEATHALVESFYGHATEINRLYSLYVSRLAATGRQRSQVRRMKVMSSSLVCEGTLLYDILGFLVDRSVDIAEGEVPANTKFSWYDVDGLSLALLGADQLYPPMLPSGAFEPLSKAARPCKEEYHNRSFVSSDESDAENSHHAAETRRRRSMGHGSLSVADHGTPSDDEEEDGQSSDASSEDGDATTDGNSAPPVRREANWLAEATAAEGGPASPVDGPLHLQEKKHKHKHRRGADDEQAAAPAAAADGKAVTKQSPGPKTRKNKRNKDDDDDDDDDDDEEGDKKIDSLAAKASATGKKRPSSAAARRPRGAKHGSESDDESESESDDDDESSSDDEEDAGVKPRRHRDDKKQKNKGKGQLRERTDEERLMHLRAVYDAPTLVDDLIRFLRGGTNLLKHGRAGKPHRRFFWVSTERGRRELLWMEPAAKKKERSSIQLDSVSYLQMGCFSKVFKRHLISTSNPSFFRCFTIGLKNGGRTVDIVTDTVADFEAWVIGLSHLVGVDPAWGGKLDITKEEGFDQLNFFESNLCETYYIFPSQYLTLKKEVQRRARRTLEVLTETGNDLKKAGAILGGIHPPGINEHGALYLTKGELRFLIPEFQLDIMRVSRIWLLFEQSHLVYDPKFIPATAFGVTQRE